MPSKKFAGFQLGPRVTGSASLEFVPDLLMDNINNLWREITLADQPGVYILGPFIVHATLPGFFGSALGNVPVDMVYKEHDAICVQVTQATCNAAVDSFKL